MSVIWETPPPRTQPVNSGKGVYAEVAEDLRSNPGEWARIKTYPYEKKNNASVMTWHLTRGHVSAFPMGEFEFCCRLITQGGKRWGIYGRYTGAQ